METNFEEKVAQEAVARYREQNKLIKKLWDARVCDRVGFVGEGDDDFTVMIIKSDNDNMSLFVTAGERDVALKVRTSMQFAPLSMSALALRAFRDLHEQGQPRTLAELRQILCSEPCETCAKARGSDKRAETWAKHGLGQPVAPTGSSDEAIIAAVFYYGALGNIDNICAIGDVIKENKDTVFTVSIAAAENAKVFSVKCGEELVYNSHIVDWRASCFTTQRSGRELADLLGVSLPDDRPSGVAVNYTPAAEKPDLVVPIKREEVE